MKRLMVVLMLLSLIMPVAAIATSTDVYIKDIDMVLTISPDWVCITKNTESIDLQGTVFDYPAMQTLVDNEIENVRATDNLHASILAVNEEAGVYSVRITSLQDAGSEDIWDLSLYTDEQLDEELSGNGASFELCSSKNDKYIVMENVSDGICVCGYTTINNGRSIQIGVYFVGEDSIDEYRQVGDKFLDNVQFTQKAPRLSSDAEKGFWETICSLFKGFAISEFKLLGRGVFWMIVLAIGYGIVLLIGKLFDKRK